MGPSFNAIVLIIAAESWRCACSRAALSEGVGSGSARPASAAKGTIAEVANGTGIVEFLTLPTGSRAALSADEECARDRERSEPSSAAFPVPAFNAEMPIKHETNAIAWSTDAVSFPHVKNAEFQVRG